ncbi:MAG: DUF4493 domain-containing protein [Bacteroidales bacterium]|nr:DUF4493 domain-containing protein [Bacteroidales bacterium]
MSLFACQQEELPSNSNVGYLSLENISIQSANVETITTRAVDTDLYVEIWDEAGTSQVGETYEPGKVPTKIELEPGNYTLKAYNAAFLDQSSWTENDKGAAVYSVDQKSFTIEAGKVNYLSVEVPMINIGVRLALPEGFSGDSGWFEDYTFTVRVGKVGEEKTVELKDEEIAYFSYSNGVKLSYQLGATNNDGELFNSGEIIYDEALSPGTIYVITYDYATKALRLLEP